MSALNGSNDYNSSCFVDAVIMINLIKMKNLIFNVKMADSRS